jgi:hypothetical protein
MTVMVLIQHADSSCCTYTTRVNGLTGMLAHTLAHVRLHEGHASKRLIV